MIKFIKQLQKAFAIHIVISRLSDMQKTSLFRMLYWKTHYEPIPKLEFHKLKGGGWLVGDDELSYVWSEKANKISNLFNGL